MINPLSIATDGYFYKRKKTLTIASSGYLYYPEIARQIVIIEEEVKKHGGISKKQRKVIDDVTVKLQNQLLLEDNEILTILKIFIKCQENALKI